MEDTQGPRALMGHEPYLVGLSTGYWSNIPMSIADVNRTKIVAGVICIIRCMENKKTQVFPISKCMITGMVVLADFNADNKIKYVIDDGTGFIDCLAWAENQESIYSLPSIPGFSGAEEKSKFAVGDRVRIFGSLNCLSVSDSVYDINVNGTLVQARDCIHEIKVTSMELLSASDTANDLNWEANHWVKSIQATKPAIGENKLGLRNAMDTLEWLGPKIKRDVENLDYFPSADDSFEAWRVFGVGCPCKLPYKDALLYCHCRATTEPLDPSFDFRDCLLQFLLKMEDEHQNNQRQSQNPQLDFRFQYRTILNQPEICQVAKKIVSESKKSKLFAPKLIKSTFDALMEDGIICLLDKKSDTHLLLSRKGVLEPYVNRRLQRNKKWSRRPFYLEKVKENRLKYIERCCQQKGY